MFLFGVIRHYVNIILRASGEKKLDPNKIRYAQTHIRAVNLIQNGNFIPKESFKHRRNYFRDHVLNEEISHNPFQSFTDPNMMQEMMKGNLATMLPNL